MNRTVTRTRNDKGDGYYGNSEPGWNRKDGD